MALRKVQLLVHSKPGVNDPEVELINPKTWYEILLASGITTIFDKGDWGKVRPGERGRMDQWGTIYQQLL